MRLPAAAILSLLLLAVGVRLVPGQGVQRYLERPELDPEEHDLYLDEYVPIPMLRVPTFHILLPRVPAVDLGALRWDGDNRDPELLVRRLDDAGVRTGALILSPGEIEGDDWPARLGPHRDRFLLFLEPDLDRTDQPGFAEDQVRRLRRAAGIGFSGVWISNRLGLFLTDGGGRRVPVDDPRLDPLWAACGELGLPVLLHSAAPAAFFASVDRHNEQYETLRKNPSLSLHGLGLPLREAILEERDRVAGRHPATVFVALHMGEEAEDLDSLARRLDALPNFHVEISGRISELGRRPYAARRFFSRYSDRILFGAGLERAEHPIYYRFLETEAEYFEYHSEEDPPAGHWRIHGLQLPEDVLARVYRDNADRLFPARR